MQTLGKPCHRHFRPVEAWVYGELPPPYSVELDLGRVPRLSVELTNRIELMAREMAVLSASTKRSPTPRTRG